MRIIKETIILEVENASISCNLSDKDKEFLIVEESGSKIVLSLDLIKRCVSIAKLEEEEN